MPGLANKTYRVDARKALHAALSLGANCAMVDLNQLLGGDAGVLETVTRSIRHVDSVIAGMQRGHEVVAGSDTRETRRLVHSACDEIEEALKVLDTFMSGRELDDVLLCMARVVARQLEIKRDQLRLAVAFDLLAESAEKSL